MTETTVRVEPQVTGKEGPGAGGEDRALLAAALAAVLVQYGRDVRERNGQGSAEGAGPQWRMVGCWERMQPARSR